MFTDAPLCLPGTSIPVCGKLTYLPVVLFPAWRKSLGERSSVLEPSAAAGWQVLKVIKITALLNAPFLDLRD